MSTILTSKRVYLDTCCWNRPFDLPQSGRVKLETDAVLYLLNLCKDVFTLYLRVILSLLK